MNYPWPGVWNSGNYLAAGFIDEIALFTDEVQILISANNNHS